MKFCIPSEVPFFTMLTSLLLLCSVRRSWSVALSLCSAKRTTLVKEALDTKTFTTAPVGFGFATRFEGVCGRFRKEEREKFGSALSAKSALIYDTAAATFRTSYRIGYSFLPLAAAEAWNSLLLWTILRRRLQRTRMPRPS